MLPMFPTAISIPMMILIAPGTTTTLEGAGYYPQVEEIYCWVCLSSLGVEFFLVEEQNGKKS